MNDNNITIEVYSSGTTILPDVSGELQKAEQLVYQTGYPGGRYLSASFFVPRDITEPWGLLANQRVVFRNGMLIVYEGWVNGFDYLDDGTIQGVRVNLEGGWSKFLMQRRTNKLWSDTRIDEKTWAWNTSQKLELWNVDRNNRILTSAKTVAMSGSAEDEAWIDYTAPEGQTIRQMTYDYYVNSASGLSMYMYIDEWYSAAWHTITAPVDSDVEATGLGPVTGSKVLTCTADVTKLRIRSYSPIAQSFTAEGRNLVGLTKVCVYSATVIDLPVIVTDAVTAVTAINSTTTYIGALASPRSLCGSVDEPVSFGAFDYDTWADVITRAASFGDGNNARYAVGLYPSEVAPTPDGKPVMFLETYPVLTTWDVSVRLDDLNVTGSIEVNQRFDDIANWIIVKYADENGFTVFITPATDAALTNAASVAAYGWRDALIDLGYCTSTAAAQNGYRALAAYKDPVFELAGPISVMGRIRTLSGEYAPVSQVYAGLRLRIENFINDLTGTATGATFLISSTQYDDSTETVTITCGPPPELLIPQLVAPIKYEQMDMNYVGVVGPDRPVGDAVTLPGGGGGGGRGRGKDGKYSQQKGKIAKMNWEKNPSGKPK